MSQYTQSMTVKKFKVWKFIRKLSPKLENSKSTLPNIRIVE